MFSFVPPWGSDWSKQRRSYRKKYRFQYKKPEVEKHPSGIFSSGMWSSSQSSDPEDEYSAVPPAVHHTKELSEAQQAKLTGDHRKLLSENPDKNATELQEAREFINGTHTDDEVEEEASLFSGDSTFDSMVVSVADYQDERYSSFSSPQQFLKYISKNPNILDTTNLQNTVIVEGIYNPEPLTTAWKKARALTTRHTAHANILRCFDYLNRIVPNVHMLHCMKVNFIVDTPTKPNFWYATAMMKLTNNYITYVQGGGETKFPNLKSLLSYWCDQAYVRYALFICPARKPETFYSEQTYVGISKDFRNPDRSAWHTFTFEPGQLSDEYKAFLADGLPERNRVGPILINPVPQPRLQEDLFNQMVPPSAKQKPITLADDQPNWKIRPEGSHTYFISEDEDSDSEDNPNDYDFIDPDDDDNTAIIEAFRDIKGQKGGQEAFYKRVSKFNFPPPPRRSRSPSPDASDSESDHEAASLILSSIGDFIKQNGQKVQEMMDSFDHHHKQPEQPQAKSKKKKKKKHTHSKSDE